MKIISWNVNGIRSVLKKELFLKVIQEEDPDVLCIQETKAQDHQVDLLLEDYDHFWNNAQKRGYAGTAVFVKKGHKPKRAQFGMDHDTEGRVITLEFERYFVVNIYTPNAQHGLARLSYRQAWDKEFLSFLKRLENKKPVIFCGDLNVAHEEIDLARPKDNMKNPGFSPEERAGFTQYMQHGFIDTFRHFHPNEPGHYSWWSVRTNARARNIGWRIDYVCVSKELIDSVTETFILNKTMGSDHCPVGIAIKE